MELSKTGVFSVSGIETNPNLFLNSDFHSTYSQTTGWDTEKNGTILASNWNGYNSGVANASTCYHAHLTQFDGEYVYVYIRNTETWLGVSQGGLQSKITANTSYTFTVDQYIANGSLNYLTGGLYYYKTGATSASFGVGMFSFSGKEKDRWNRCLYTFTTPSDIDLTKNVSWYIYGYSGGAGTVYMRRPKLEESLTPFMLAESEGTVKGYHGFQEGAKVFSVHDSWVEANEFIEW